MDEQALILKAQKEYEYWFQFVETKRDQRREDLETYVQESAKEKVNIHSIYSQVQTLMSIYYQNKIVVKWRGKNRYDREVALNTNKTSKYDYKEMNVDVLDYVLQFDVFMKWVWVLIWDGFDKNSIVPKWKVIDPLSCIFDPEWGATIKDHRFFGIEMQLPAYEIKKRGWKLEDTSEEYTQDLNRRKIKEVRGYSDTPDDTDNKMVDVYYHFTRLEDGKPILLILGKSRWILLDYKILTPVTKEEKQDPFKIYFPVALKYYSYVPWDPLSISVPDLLRDKQSYYSQLFNAMLASAIRSSMWDDRFVNTKKIKDLKGLQKPSIQGKLIPVNIGDNENISNVIYSIPKDNIGNLPFNLKSYLEEQMALDTGIDRNTTGVLSTENATLGEREMAQRNANIKFLLATKQGNWFEEFRWQYLWYRIYQANLSDSEEKLVHFNNSYSPSNYAFRKDDFIGRENLRIEIVNRAEREQEINSRKADRMALLPQLIAGAKSEDERTILYREMLESQWEDEEYIMAMFPYTTTELKAYDKLALIEEWDISGAIVDNINEAHEIYINIFNTAETYWKAEIIKQDALRNRYRAKIMRDTEMQQMPAENGALNAAQNVSSAQLTNASIQQNKNVASTQDIL